MTLPELGVKKREKREEDAREQRQALPVQSAGRPHSHSQLSLHPCPDPKDPIVLRQWEIRDVIYPDELSDSESAKVLEGFDIAEPRHWIEQLDGSWWQSFKNENQGHIQKEQCS